MLINPEFIYLNNLNNAEIKNLNKFPEEYRDSVLFENSLYLRFINDSVFRSKYYQSMYTSLELAGFRMYDDSNWTEFLKLDKAMMLSIAQLQMEEYTYPFYQKGTFQDTVVYSKSIDINGISLNSWFEITPVNSSVPPLVLYNSTILEDKIDGRFYWNPFTDDYPYYYTRYDFDLSDVDKLAETAGKENAALLFDFLMNKYVDSHRKKELPDEYYLHYDRQKKRFVFAGQSRLSNLDP